MAGVVLRREPLDLKLGAIDVGPFRAGELRARMFDFGVIALRFTFPITDLSALPIIDLGNRLMLESAAFDRAARTLCRSCCAHSRAVVPWEGDTTTPLMEDFTVFTLPRIPAGDIEPQHVLAHMLLGEPRQRKLAASTVHELGRRTIHYYQDDLVLVDYDAAIIVDEDDAPDLVDIFGIASAQLLSSATTTLCWVALSNSSSKTYGGLASRYGSSAAPSASSLVERRSWPSSWGK